MDSQIWSPSMSHFLWLRAIAARLLQGKKEIRWFYPQKLKGSKFTPANLHTSKRVRSAHLCLYFVVIRIYDTSPFMCGGRPGTGLALKRFVYSVCVGLHTNAAQRAGERTSEDLVYLFFHRETEICVHAPGPFTFTWSHLADALIQSD